MNDDIYKDVYEDLCDIIGPFVKVDRYGLSKVTSDSLTASVIESVEYLVEFWIANRGKPNIEDCL